MSSQELQITPVVGQPSPGKSTAVPIAEPQFMDYSPKSANENDNSDACFVDIDPPYEDTPTMANSVADPLENHISHPTVVGLGLTVIGNSIETTSGNDRPVPTDSTNTGSIDLTAHTHDVTSTVRIPEQPHTDGSAMDHPDENETAVVGENPAGTSDPVPMDDAGDDGVDSDNESPDGDIANHAEGTMPANELVLPDVGTGKLKKQTITVPEDAATKQLTYNELTAVMYQPWSVRAKFAKYFTQRGHIRKKFWKVIFKEDDQGKLVHPVNVLRSNLENWPAAYDNYKHPEAINHQGLVRKRALKLRLDQRAEDGKYVQRNELRDLSDVGRNEAVVSALHNRPIGRTKLDENQIFCPEPELAVTDPELKVRETNQLLLLERTQHQRICETLRRNATDQLKRAEKSEKQLREAHQNITGLENKIEQLAKKNSDRKSLAKKLKRKVKKLKRKVEKLKGKVEKLRGTKERVKSE